MICHHTYPAHQHHPQQHIINLASTMDYAAACNAADHSPLPLEMVVRLSDFSIDHILHRAGTRPTAERRAVDFYPMRLPSATADAAEASTLGWLQYSRYHPPRLQKSQPKSGSGAPVRRTPGRLPRVPFSAVQLSALEAAYRRSSYLSAEDANRLAERLELTSTRVKIWFQNRRARERRERRDQQQHDDQTIGSTALAAGSANEGTVVALGDNVHRNAAVFNVNNVLAVGGYRMIDLRRKTEVMLKP